MDRAGFRIVGTIYQSFHPCMDKCSGTHRAGLDGGEKFALPEPVVTHRFAGFPQSDNFSVGCGIAVLKIAIPPSSYDFAIADHNGSNRHLVYRQRSLRRSESLFHPEFVVIFRLRISRREFFVNLLTSSRPVLRTKSTLHPKAGKSKFLASLRTQLSPLSYLTIRVLRFSGAIYGFIAMP